MYDHGTFYTVSAGRNMTRTRETNRVPHQWRRHEARYHGKRDIMGNYIVDRTGLSGFVFTTICFAAPEESPGG